ncbi:MAG: TlpA family protein disulfide reductase [FCB group bacterium]|nr:TlpA family protein disulfide reductase [FCB group bacterium]
MKRSYFVVTAVIFGIFGLFLLNGQNKISDAQKKKIAALTKDINLAPDFALRDVSTDSVVTLSALKGKVVLVNFWATWCYPCRMEIPDFNDLYNKYKKDGLVILGISVSDQKKALKNFMNSFQIDYPILYGSPNDLGKITMQYGGINAVPTTFLIDREGQIVKSYPGALLKGQPFYYGFMQNLAEELGKKVKREVSPPKK